MYHYRLLVLCACIWSPVGAGRMATKSGVPPCHPLLDFDSVVQFRKLNGTQQVSLLESRGCEVRSNPVPATADYTCEENSFACASNVPNGTNYMCCKVKYLTRGGPKITTMFGESLHLFETGLSTLFQIPKVSEAPPSLLVKINVQPYAPYWYTMGCEEGRISEVVFNGTAVGESSLTVRSGALSSSEPFAFRLGEGPWQDVSWNNYVVDNETTLLSSPGVTVTSMISAKDPKHWGPDASATVTVGGLSFGVQQRTLGNGDESKSMLDVSVQGTYSKSAGVGGLLGPDGAILLQSVEAVPCMAVDSSVRA
uniref:Uncharacterized protein n=1 Tax=Noctiluca scintillans TaxID=2966 RepID=A0A7S1AMD4_NOCSC|mmetsp:Transcript_52092/g.138830  ORF Transcript_52092/g.138830 Transcript_52092/m.138830 type:complete len:310 (+) Transcript_52092:97-1026(+)